MSLNAHTSSLSGLICICSRKQVWRGSVVFLCFVLFGCFVFLKDKRTEDYKEMFFPRLNSDHTISVVVTGKQRGDPSQQKQPFSTNKLSKSGQEGHRAREEQVCHRFLVTVLARLGLRRSWDWPKVLRNSNESLCNYVLSRKNGKRPVPVLGADGVMLADDRYQAELFNSYLLPSPLSLGRIFKLERVV